MTRPRISCAAVTTHPAVLWPAAPGCADGQLAAQVRGRCQYGAAVLPAVVEAVVLEEEAVEDELEAGATVSALAAAMARQVQAASGVRVVGVWRVVHHHEDG